MRILLIGLFFWVILVSSCSREKTKEEILVGSWKAYWETDPNSYPELKTEKKFTMDGFLEFTKDGQLSISAYGYPECIFSVDTIQHQLNWKIKNDTIHFISGNDPYGIPYKINEIENELVRLQLMDDITLTLFKLD